MLENGLYVTSCFMFLPFGKQLTMLKSYIIHAEVVNFVESTRF